MLYFKAGLHAVLQGRSSCCASLGPWKSFYRPPLLHKLWHVCPIRYRFPINSKSFGYFPSFHTHLFPFFIGIQLTYTYFYGIFLSIPYSSESIELFPIFPKIYENGSKNGKLYIYNHIYKSIISVFRPNSQIRSPNE